MLRGLARPDLKRPFNFGAPFRFCVKKATTRVVVRLDGGRRPKFSPSSVLRVPDDPVTGGPLHKRRRHTNRRDVSSVSFSSRSPLGDRWTLLSLKNKNSLYFIDPSRHGGEYNNCRPCDRCVNSIKNTYCADWRAVFLFFTDLMH